MPHHTTAGGFGTFIPVRHNSRGYQNHLKTENSVRNVLIGRTARPFQSREGVGLDRQIEGRRSRLQSRTNSSSSTVVQQIISTSSSLDKLVMRGVASRHNLRIRQAFTPLDFDNKREHRQHEISPWNEEPLGSGEEGSSSYPSPHDDELHRDDGKRESSRSLSFLVGNNHLVHSMNEGQPQSFERRRRDLKRRRKRSHKSSSINGGSGSGSGGSINTNININTTNNTNNTNSKADTADMSELSKKTMTAVTATRLPGISLRVEMQSLFAVGSRLATADKNRRNYRQKRGHGRKQDDNGDNNSSGATSPERAMSPFSEWMDDRRLSSPDFSRPPMSADVASSERYQLKYNRASTVTTSNEKRNKRQEQRSLKILNEKRSQMLLDELKLAINNKKKMKKIALAEQRMFTAEFQLRQKVMQPLSPPQHCHLPSLCAPNQHPSHPGFSTFFPNQVEEPNSLGQQLSHSRLSSYQFNVAEPPPLLDKEAEREYQRVLLESREEKKKKKEKLASSFWKKMIDQESAEQSLITLMSHVMHKNNTYNSEAGQKDQPRRGRRKQGVLATTRTTDDTCSEEMDTPTSISSTSQEVPISPHGKPKGWFHSPKIFFPTKEQQDNAQALGEVSVYLNYFSPGL